MPTILHVITGLGLGGAETMLTQLACRLQECGFKQHVVSLSGRGVLADVLERSGIPVTELTLAANLSAGSKLIALRRLIKDVEPDVLQGWMYHGNLVASLAHFLAPQRRKRHLFWNVRASDVDGARYGGVLAWSRLLSGTPDVVIFNSKAGLDFHNAIGFHPRRIEIIANGIDTGKFRPDSTTREALRSEYGIGIDDLLVLHVARVDPMKDHSTFLAAMRMLPQVKAILVGAGTEQLELPPNVHASGLRLDVEHLYRAADIVASSSAFGEGFSNVLAEGMSSGLVPIATDVGDAKIIVGDAGMIVPPGNAQAFAEALSKAAVLAPDTRRNLGLQARERIVSQFSMERAVEIFERLYLDRPIRT
jgi:glycosyltransferase involved in cell wall biosynthesis